MNLSGREFLGEEFETYKARNLLTHDDVEVVKGLVNTSGKWFCQRCLNERQYRFADFVYKRKRITYCRDCLDFKMISSDSLLYRSKVKGETPSMAGELDVTFKLSYLQQQASDFSKMLLKNSGIGILWAVCGAGKTEMMFESISIALTAGKRVCWAIPRADVVIELVPRLRKAFPKAKVIGLHGHSNEKNIEGHIVISTMHQLIRFYQAFDFLIVDEVDAFPYTFDEMLPRLVQKSCKSDCGIVYLSATPNRAYQKLIKSGSLKSCIIPARYHLYSLDVPQFKWCGQVEKALTRYKVPSSILKWLNQKLICQRRALLFVPTINMGKQLQTALKNQLGIEVPFVYSSDEGRFEKVQSFKQGQGQFLITTMILERGVTIVDIDVAIIAAHHEIFEESALVQISGRVGRSPNYPHGDIIFFHAGVTMAMEYAREQIKGMNQQAMAQGLLKDR